jgi:xylan 1,4-beta-xylosidase
MRTMFLTLILAAPLFAAEKLQFANPVLPGDYPDPSVIRVGNEYWATATTSEWAPLFPILKSTDLVTWEHVGNAFEKRPEWSVGNYWAPEIAEHKGTYFMYYVGRKKGGPLSLAVATAPHPSGPWTDHGPMIGQEVGSIDAVPISDEKGDRYLIWKEDGNSRKRPTPLWIQKLSPDGTKLVGEMKEIMRNDAPWERNLIEGPFVVRRNDWYYLFYSGSACCGRECDYALGVARAKDLLGPWEKYQQNPILAGNAEWKCPGHGSIVTDAQGRDYLLYHAYHAKTFVYVGRQGLLDEITWQENGWPSINNNKGPSTNSAIAISANALNFSDEFSNPKLRPEWQWPQNNHPDVKVSGGFAVLRPAGTNATDVVASVIAVKTTTANYTALTALDTKGLSAESKAGLSAYGDRENALGVTSDGTTITLWRRQRNKTETVATIPSPKTPRLHLQMAAKDGHRFQFAASADGQEWKSVGNDVNVEGQHLPPWDRGIRVALTSGGSEKATARFDFLKVTASGK